MGIQLNDYIIMVVFMVTVVLISFASSASMHPARFRNRLEKGNSNNKALEPIDLDGKYQLGYEANLNTSTITFSIVVETIGYIGFGLSLTGGMTGADIIIGGVYENGTSYFSDRHGVGNSVPVVDAQQDWTLEGFSQNDTHTSLEVSRLFNTCDEEGDIAISADTMKVIWSYGSTDDISYHGGTNRGTYSVNLLDPRMPPFDDSGSEIWTITAEATMPAVVTTYWCSIYTNPNNYTSTRHAIGFNTRLETASDIKHTHHFSLFRCTAPAGQDPDEVFGPLVGHEGGDCFEPNPVVPMHLCRSPIYIWAVGGKMMTLPEDVGFPITENGQREYIMVEMHYDNPEAVPGVRVRSHVDIYNTLALRPVEASLAVVMREMTYSQLLPPQQTDFMTVGHCSSECTQTFIPPTGSFVFNVLLHSHKAGRKIKFRHFRDRAELPWISNDDNYDFDFQQNRPLREHVQLLPGDHLTVECIGNTMDRGNNVTIAGYGTEEEMCQIVFFVYPRNSFTACSSSYDEAQFISKFGNGIEGVYQPNMITPPVITAPASLANRSYTEYLSTTVNWTPALVAELQEETVHNGHLQYYCGGVVNRTAVNYPEVDSVYVPDNPCSLNETTTTTTTAATSITTTLPSTSTTTASTTQGTNGAGSLSLFGGFNLQSLLTLALMLSFKMLHDF